MAATATPSTQVVTPKPCISASQRISRSSIAYFGNETKGTSWTKLRISSLTPTAQTFSKMNGCNELKFERHGIKAMSGASDRQPLPGLPIDLRGWTLLCFASIISFS